MRSLWSRMVWHGLRDRCDVTSRKVKLTVTLNGVTWIPRPHEHKNCEWCDMDCMTGVTWPLLTNPASCFIDVVEAVRDLTLGDVVLEVRLGHLAARVEMHAEVVPSKLAHVRQVDPLAIDIEPVDVETVRRNALGAPVGAVPFSVDPAVAPGVFQAETGLVADRCLGAILHGNCDGRGRHGICKYAVRPQRKLQSGPKLRNTRFSLLLAITKTSGKLGPNHHRNGAWDRLEGQDSIKQSINQAKDTAVVNCCVPSCTTNSQHYRGAAFLLGICASKRSQVPLRCWFPPRFPLVLVMANCHHLL